MGRWVRQNHEAVVDAAVRSARRDERVRALLLKGSRGRVKLMSSPTSTWEPQQPASHPSRNSGLEARWLGKG